MKLKFLSNAICIAVLWISACTNISEQKSLTTTTNPSLIGTVSTTYTHIVKNAAIVSLTDGSGLELSLTTDTGTAGYQSLAGFCAVGSTTTPCACELTWTEVNTVGGSATSFQRTKRSPLTTVQSGLAKCKFTSAFWAEIPDATTIRMNIVAVTPNVSGLNAQSVGFKKGSSTTPNGDFVDDTLTPFRNIYRYTCASRRNNTYEILNQYTQGGTDPNIVNVLYADRFCTGGGSPSASCPTPRSGFSAQSYYRNLFVRSDKLGTINSKNTYYDCPKVDESISYSAGQTIPAAEKQKYWPLDATFSLATTYSSDWSVPIRAGSILYKSGDSNSDTEKCDAAVDSDDTRYLNETNVVAQKCIGYAKKPKVDGTCGTITDNSGRVRPLVRLRRYRAVFPATFTYTGATETRSAYADEVYIADRLVVASTGVPTGAMIYGPKPCNYAWFDHEGVTNDGQLERYGETGVDFKNNFRGSGTYPSSFPSYVSTSKYQFYNGLLPTDPGYVKYSVNPDGRVLPNIDRDGTIGGLSGPSCSAAVGIVDQVMGVPSAYRVLTANEKNSMKLTMGSRSLYMSEIHVNPIDPWTPNYVEDTSFQACAPVADPYLEPPLHFYKKINTAVTPNTYSIAWCAKVYPTQNPYWTDLNSKKRFTSAVLSQKLVNYPGGAAKVKGFTSHVDSDGNAAVGTPTILDHYNKCSATSYDKICASSLGVTSGTDFDNCKNYLTAGSDANGAWVHGNTCDRTVSYDASADFRTFPLQAKDADVETMLSNDLDHDKSFSCQYSVNADASKVNQKMPSSACCGVINGNAVLKSIINGGNGGGHLEPLLNSSSPSIRFCGNPVE